MDVNKIYNMDCLEGMKQLEDNSVDLIVTDPPYGYSFMNKDWDKAIPKLEIWKECLRVLKDGAFCFVMSAPRQDVQSQMILRLQNAGFNISFTPLYWAYASGFPKASNISKMVDKKMGAEREVIGQKKRGDVEEAKKRGTTFTQAEANRNNKDIFGYGIEDITIPKTPQAKALDGSYGGFQPKPAVELILVAMKPCTEKTYVNQALKNRHGITWLDDCRVPYESEVDKESSRFGTQMDIRNNNYVTPKGVYGKDILASPTGRFPANLLVSDDVLNDGIISKSIGGCVAKNINGFASNNQFVNYGDSGSFSRYFDLDKWFINKLPDSVKKTFPFFIVPKASKGEKNDGMNGFEDGIKQSMGDYGNQSEFNCPDGANRVGNKGESIAKNIHPTVKPTKLISYLITLGSRENDLILDPFIGSGTTAIASRQLSRNFIGYEQNEEYHKIALARIKDYMEQKKLNEEC